MAKGDLVHLQALMRTPTSGPSLQLGSQGMEQVFFNVPDYLELDVGSGELENTGPL